MKFKWMLSFNLLAVLTIISVSTFLFNCQPPQNEVYSIEEKIINGLRPAVYWKNEGQTFTLKQRMKKWNVPAVSIAIIDDMKIIWTGAYGYKRINDSAKVNSNTLFQAASISKPVAAVGVMDLSSKDIINIDADINSLFTNWKLPENNYSEKVTIRKILSHSAGLNVGGFEGYWSEDSLPSLLEILEGKPPANSGKVIIQAKPGTKYIYSGGGYQVMQKAVEDVTGKSFVQLMNENIFKPLGMNNSHYAPLDSSLKTNAAYGHFINEYIPNHAPIHMESAAGGLWTTPTDLGILIIEIMKAYNNLSDKIIDSTTARSMMETVFWDFGLGFKVLGKGRNLRFSHGGATTGWHSHFMAFPERGEAVIIMTNGLNGWVLWPEIERSVAKYFDWPNLKPKLIYPDYKISNYFSGYTGVYMMGDLKVNIFPDSSHLILRGGGLLWNLIPTKKDTFEIVEMEGQVFFKRDKDSQINGLHLWFGEPDWSPYRQWDFIKKSEKQTFSD